MRVLLVGGSGPTGPLIVKGLRERDCEVTLFHRGTHELPELDDLEHLHGDPFDADSIAATLDGREFDLAIATYGRIRLLARALAERSERLITISGAPVYAGYLARGDERLPVVPIREDDPLVDLEPSGPGYPAHLIRRTEETALELGATVLRYPIVYGPRVPHPWEWLVVRRILDDRPFVMVPDGGLSLHSRASTWNAAHTVLAAVDAGDAGRGRAYNVADDRQCSLRQWIGAIAEIMGAKLELLSIPGEVPSPARYLLPFGYTGVAPHALFANGRAAAELGYSDSVAPLEGLRRTVEWCVENRDHVSAENLSDPFDYAAEDRLAAAWRGALGQVKEAAAAFAGDAEYRTPQSGSAAPASGDGRA